MTSTEAKSKNPTLERILYIPHDNRPVSNKQTVEVIEKLGYEVIVPPDELLGNRDNLGDPEKLWEWLEASTDKDRTIKAMVISADSMLYGSLVGSRKHNYTEDIITQRAERFRAFRKEHKKVPIYVFASIMRTPRTGEASGHEEPAYYRSYGADIFRYTELLDKQEMDGLNKRETKELEFLKKLIPEQVISDWLGRRNKNFNANKILIDLVKEKAFNYLLLGRDDNAPYSQTHMESRHLQEYGAYLGRTKYQAIAGIDEIGIMLLTRAVNDMTNNIPFIYVGYGSGTGPATVPSYSDETIEKSIEAAILVTGAMKVPTLEKADIVLAVNTNPNGKTYEANTDFNNGRERDGTAYFVEMVNDYINKGCNVAVADIAFANGADNAIMEQFRNRGLLFKLKAYAGWNTPTNSMGFVLSTGMLTKRMSAEAVDELLVTRYLDDWAYQSNIRNIIAGQLTWLRGDGWYGDLDGKKDAVSDRATKMLNHFVENNLPPFEGSECLFVTFPWDRMFEADILLGTEAADAIYKNQPHITVK
ncbi:MAG: DUF4127 family protein [Selenomonadaceae bacterium]|nr:DUF4127 family protein [Selenomonadaceae bacterium]MBR1858108.1 DUF4127 family protein [Selenomonadaceae bacterium]